MNPFTRFLSQWGDQTKKLEQFIAHWDTVEALAIQVYKQGEASDDDEADYAVARHYLEQHYDQWAAGLRPYWQASVVGGTLDHQDPFLFLFERPLAADFVGNWKALQHLPAAREALNQFLVAQGEV